jgi:hypothetical protein
MAARVMQTDDRNFLKFFEWSHLILDEAHLVKNAASARSKKIRVMAKRCQRRLLLTVQTPFPPCCSRCKPPSPFCLPATPLSVAKLSLSLLAGIRNKFRRCVTHRASEETASHAIINITRRWS